jgi:hypothetical protein
MRKLRSRQYSFKQQTQIKPQNKALGPLASNMNHSLTEATLQLPFSCMGQFSAKVVFLILEITEREALFPYTANSVHNVKQTARPSPF